MATVKWRIFYLRCNIWHYHDMPVMARGTNTTYTTSLPLPFMDLLQKDEKIKRRPRLRRVNNQLKRLRFSDRKWKRPRWGTRSSTIYLFITGGIPQWQITDRPCLRTQYSVLEPLNNENSTEDGFLLFYNIHIARNLLFLLLLHHETTTTLQRNRGTPIVSNPSRSPHPLSRPSHHRTKPIRLALPYGYEQYNARSVMKVLCAKEMPWDGIWLGHS